MTHAPPARLQDSTHNSLLDASDDLLRDVVMRFALLADLEAPEQVRWFVHWLAQRTGGFPGCKDDEFLIALIIFNVMFVFVVVIIGR